MSSMVPIKQNSRSILASCYLNFSLRSSPALPAMDDINYRSPAKTFSRLGRASLNGKSRQCNMSAYDNMWPEQRRTWRQQRGPARTLRGPKEAAEKRRKNQGNRRRTSEEARERPEARVYFATVLNATRLCCRSCEPKNVIYFRASNLENSPNLSFVESTARIGF